MKIFAFGHRRYVGKDTATRFLVNHIRLEHGGRQVHKISFAWKMKEMCFDLYGPYGLQPPDYYELNPNAKDAIIPALNCSARSIWIRFGNWCREIHDRVWIDYAIDHALANIAVVADLRFISEVNALKERGAVLIKINRNSIEKHDDVADSNLKDYTGWDYVINNDGSLSDLHRQVVEIVNKELR